MSGETKTNWPSYAAVIVICAAIGFGAVYAIVGGGDNSKRSIAGAARDSALDTARNSGAPPGPVNEVGTLAASAATAQATGGAALAGPDGKPLNRGAMTTFVFKKQPMPIEERPSFVGPDGQAMTIADFKGKVILLNLWATWCAPCRKEMPHLNELQRELGSDQFEVVALSIDRGAPDKPKQFLAEVGATALRFYHDPTAQAGFAFMAIGMPTTLLIDREGREIGRLVGPAEWHSQDAKDLIKAAIAAG